MRAASPDDAVWFSGREYDWIAVDEVYEMAFFTSGGAPLVPSNLVDLVDQVDEAVEEVLQLPVIGHAEFFPDVVGARRNLWRDVAERGLYAFDIGESLDAYVLVARPSLPVRLADVAVSSVGLVSDVVSRFVVRGTVFSRFGRFDEYRFEDG